VGTDVRGMKGRGEGVMVSLTDRHNSNKNKYGI
jgi:hypothetical protein